MTTINRNGAELAKRRRGRPTKDGATFPGPPLEEGHPKPKVNVDAARAGAADGVHPPSEVKA